MAKKQTQLGKVLADLDGQIALLQRAREIIVKAIAEAPKRKPAAAKVKAAA